jgi:hypothetical protein
MTQVKQTVYLISEQQRTALLNYLQDRPFREVAAGIQFLMNAPTATLNVEVPEEQMANLSAGEAAPEAASETEHEMATV